MAISSRELHYPLIYPLGCMVATVAAPRLLKKLRKIVFPFILLLLSPDVLYVLAAAAAERPGINFSNVFWHC